jgi:hypothetical protein
MMCRADLGHATADRQPVAHEVMLLGIGALVAVALVALLDLGQTE